MKKFLSFFLLINLINIGGADEHFYCPQNISNLTYELRNSSNDVIYLDSGVYEIDYSVCLDNNTTLIGCGNNSTVLYTDNYIDCSSQASPGIIYLHRVKNVTLCNLSFLGPAKDMVEQHDNGGTDRIGGYREARNGIRIYNSDNITIDNCTFRYLLSDGIRVSRSRNVSIYNSSFNTSGHDSISLFKTGDVNISKCFMNLLINTCVRFDHAFNVSVENCTFVQALSGSGAGYLELQNEIKNISICNNTFLKSVDPVFFRVNCLDDVYFKNNTLKDISMW